MNFPFTLPLVKKEDVPSLARDLNFLLAVKVPHSAAGVGIYLITNEADLDDFMKEKQPYEDFVVQALIGHRAWYQKRSNHEQLGNQLYPRPCKTPVDNLEYVYDIRFIIACGDDGWHPAYVLARRAENPLEETIPEPGTASSVLKTNLSRIAKDGSQKLDESMALILTEETFQMTGLSLVDLVEGYIQSILSAVAVDRMCQRLMPDKEHFDLRMFQEMCPDKDLLEEVCKGTPQLRNYALDTQYW